MQLQPLDTKKIAEMTAIAQAQKLLKTLTLDELDAIWRKDCQANAQAFLSESGYRGHYRYHDRHAINVSACWWGRDGFQDDQLVICFSAKYSHTDLNLILHCCSDEHWAYYWVESDGSLTWAQDEYAKKGDV
jgi:hypothetical protein